MGPARQVKGCCFDFRQLSGLPHLLNDTSQRLNSFGINLGPAQPQGLCFQDEAKAVDFLDFFITEADHKLPAARHIHHQATLLQLLERLANGNSAHPQIARQLALVEPFTRLDFA